MKKECLPREIAEEITYLESNITEKLIYIGAGSNCQVYSTESGDIIKEFLPIIAGDATLSRKDGKNLPLTYINSLPEKYVAIVDERRVRFYNEEKIVEKLNRAFCHEKNNMFVAPEFIETSLGRCQRYRLMSGTVLSNLLHDRKKDKRGKIKPFAKRFSETLPYLISLFTQVEIYHRSGFLNLDIKPDNLIVVNFDNHEGIRNIDFGSTMSIEALLEGINTYARENKGLTQSELKAQIGTKFFASSAPFYSKERIEGCIEKCLDKNVSENEKKILLKQLDVIAAWKTLLYAMCESDEFWAAEAFREYGYEINIFDDLFLKLFRDNEITELGSLFANYNVFIKLYEVSKKIFAPADFFMDASEITEALSDILYIIKGVDPKNNTGKRHIIAADINRALMSKDEYLKKAGLYTVADVLDFCEKNSNFKENGLKKRATPAELYLYLLVN